MKKFFSTLLILLVVNFTFANEKLNHADNNPAVLSLTIQNNNTIEKIDMNFNSVDDFQQFELTDLNKILPVNSDDCTVTATITVSYTANVNANGVVVSGGGSTTVSISATITASCDEIAAAMRDVRDRLLKVVRGQ